MQSSNLPNIGLPLEGGFYAGKIRIGEEIFAIIVSPKLQGERESVAWGEYGKEIDGAGSVFDGRSNTIAMAEAGSDVAQWALTLQINGFSDWYIPSRDELEIIYRNLKPTTEENYTWRHGENISAVPPTYAYTEQLPAQTTVAAFQEGGSDAFADTWHWTSSQYSPGTAWGQHFEDGGQTTNAKGYEFAVRAVRRLLVIQ